MSMWGGGRGKRGHNQTKGTGLDIFFEKRQGKCMELVCLPLGEGGVSQTCNSTILPALVRAVPGPVCSYVFKSKSFLGGIQVCLSFSHTASCMHRKKH